MATYTITCADPDHLSRSGKPGWKTILGTSSILNVGGHICTACANAQPPAKEPPEDAQLLSVSVKADAILAGDALTTLSLAELQKTVAALVKKVG